MKGLGALLKRAVKGLGAFHKGTVRVLWALLKQWGVREHWVVRGLALQHWIWTWKSDVRSLQPPTFFLPLLGIEAATLWLQVQILPRRLGCEYLGISAIPRTVRHETHTVQFFDVDWIPQFSLRPKPYALNPERLNWHKSTTDWLIHGN